MLARLAAFARLTRVKFLAGGLAGGAFGTLLAGFQGGSLDWRPYGVAQTAITAFHLMTHYANEYFDRNCDSGVPSTPFSGGSGVLRSNQLTAAVALYAAGACAVLGAGASAILWSVERQPAAALLALAIGALAWSYSAPPLRLCARGLGEAATALVVGMLVPLCAYAAQRGWPDTLALSCTLPGAAAMFAMMLAVEYPDLAADAASGKRTLVVRVGARRSKPLALGALGAVYATTAGAVAAGAPSAYAWVEALSLPLAFGYARALLRHREPDAQSNEALAGHGVALSFIVTFYGALAFAAVLP